MPFCFIGIRAIHLYYTRMGFYSSYKQTTRNTIPPGLAGITHINGFGKRYPIAVTEDEASQNLYNRINHNANWDQDGKKKFTLYPTEVMSLPLVRKVLKKYRELVGTGTMKSINNINDKTVFNFAVEQVALQTKVSVSVVTTILRELFYSVRTTNDISEEILSPGFKKAPTPEQSQSWANEQKKAELVKKEDDLNKQADEQDCGFFCKISNSISDVVGAGATGYKVIAIGVPVVIVGTGAWILYAIGRKVMQFDINKGFREQQRTNRAVAPSVAKALI